MAVNEFVEFQKQYEKTYIRIKFENSDHFQVVLVKQCVADNSKSPYIILSNPVIGNAIITWDNTLQVVDSNFPAVGLFNHEDCFMMLNRFPDR